MEEASSEETLIENAFGTVTSKRVVYKRSKGWLRGGSREDIPLKHVTSVRLETSRSILAGTFFLLVGLIMTFGGKSMLGGFFGMSLVSLGIVLIWGSPAVYVNTSGQDLQPSKGAPWERKDADSFVEALRSQIFKD